MLGSWFTSDYRDFSFFNNSVVIEFLEARNNLPTNNCEFENLDIYTYKYNYACIYNIYMHI